MEQYHPYTPTNAINLYKIIAHPHTRTLLHVLAIKCHPQGDIIQRHICLPEDGDLLPKHAGQFICRDDYSHNTWNK
jgi:hypothetical protein